MDATDWSEPPLAGILCSHTSAADASLMRRSFTCKGLRYRAHADINQLLEARALNVGGVLRWCLAPLTSHKSAGLERRASLIASWGGTALFYSSGGRKHAASDQRLEEGDGGYDMVSCMRVFHPSLQEPVHGQACKLQRDTRSRADF